MTGKPPVVTPVIPVVPEKTGTVTRQVVPHFKACIVHALRTIKMYIIKGWSANTPDWVAGESAPYPAERHQPRCFRIS